MPPRRQPAAARSRSLRRRDRYVRYLARLPGETMEEHEWRLVTFFLYIMRKEAFRLRQDLLTTRARTPGRLDAHARAAGLREALMAMLVPPMDETPGGALALTLRLRRALLVILPRGSEGGAAAESSEDS